MKSAVLFSAAALVASVAGLTVNTPGPVVECEPTAITWTGGTAPFYLSFALHSDPTGPAQQSYGPLQSSPFTWQTNITANIDLIINLKDNTGTVAQSGNFIVQSGSDSCLTSSGSSSAASGSGSSSTASTAGSSATSGASTSGGSATTSRAFTNSASGSATTSGSGAAATTSSGAMANAANVLAAGVVGAGVFAFLA